LITKKPWFRFNKRGIQIGWTPVCFEGWLVILIWLGAALISHLKFGRDIGFIAMLGGGFVVVLIAFFTTDNYLE
jgi:hypothetical protein